jgi:tetratricopeptide (TPR) repeat protein
VSSLFAIEACHEATAHLGRGEIDRAEAIIEPFLAARPKDPNLLYVTGNCRLARGQYEEAAALYERALSAAPDFAAVLLNLGFVRRQQHRLEEARTTLRRCVVLDPSDAVAWLNLTSTYVNEGEPTAGEAVAREALAHCPSSPDIRWNLGLLLLEQGKWREGWQEYRHRFDTTVLRTPAYGFAEHRPRRLHSIDDLRAGQTVVCHGEQGLGDEILFAGMLSECIADVQARGATLVLDCNQRLRSVFARNFAAELLPADAAAAAAVRGQPVDWVLPIGDCAALYRNDDVMFPRRAGYLLADPEKTAALRATLAARANGRPLVGIAWSGGTTRTHSLYRRIPLIDWLPVLSQPACFVALEYQNCSDEVHRLAASRGIDIVHLPDLTLAADYARTFELVSALDLVITVPTSVLHVAGAVGTPCWVVMHHKAAWRECSRDRAIPWYPRTHLRFVRGPDSADWRQTLSEAAAELASRLAAGGPRIDFGDFTG